ncbi:hypothetical protein NEOLEDRAFT_1074943 [Neolentinus lepideus HHB14362 ss-1]|uniref:Uncharacterized protein n=1 Tax=Neolentinus lepideus HHB14362 ss-1 TaxID=1314782 RepID=A0A165PAG2_9AGAM|nr:hypothetical protein NEOLEDRAFT_1074943 [Neolentinus lepideus HHB14362 ss-1]
MPVTFFPPDATGKHLPDFSTLLIKGSYHSSAAIHLCLSRLKNAPDAKALLLTPSRHAFVHALQELDDDWLTLFAGYGRVAALSSRIEVHYPPTPIHLAFFLSTLRKSSCPEEGNLPGLQNVYLNLPRLIVLHELSSYFSESEAT